MQTMTSVFILSASLDYDNVTMVLNFSSAVTMETVNLNILDDDVLEINETFRVVLELVNLDNDGRVKLQPNETEVSIVLDNDSKCIKYIQRSVYFSSIH